MSHGELLLAVKLSEPEPEFVTFTCPGMGLTLPPCPPTNVNEPAEMESTAGAGGGPPLLPLPPHPAQAIPRIPASSAVAKRFIRHNPFG
jgi:hypothetical protein